MQVDPSFRDLPTHAQEATVDEISRAWDAQNGSDPEGDANRRSRAQRQLIPRGLADEEVFGPAPPDPAPARDTSYGGAARESLGSLTRGLGATARVVGNATDNATLRGIGTSLTGALPTDSNYEAATPQLVDAVRRVEIGRALGHLTRAVVENVGSLGATLAGGAVGGAVAGPPGALLGAYTAAGAQNFGTNVEERAASNNRQEPNSDDLVAGGLTTAGQAALEAFGAVGRGARLVTNPVMRPSGVVARARGLAGRSVRVTFVESEKSIDRAPN